MFPALNPTRGVVKPHQATLSDRPLDTPLPQPHLRYMLPPYSQSKQNKGFCCWFSLSPVAARTPIKPRQKKKKQEQKADGPKTYGQIFTQVVILEVGNFISSAHAKVSWESMLGNTKVGSSSGCQGGVCELLVNMYSSTHLSQRK